MQNYGPKCNFKKKKVKVGNFDGYPLFTQFIQERFKSIDILQNFQTVEQCSLEYLPERGSSIDPHIDDCWIWGERIPTLNLLSDSTLTLLKFEGPPSKYNLEDSFNYPRLFNEDNTLKSEQQLLRDYEILKSTESQISEDIFSENDKPQIIRIPMPRRSLLVFYGDPRYNWEHGIIREDIKERRVCITYRELTLPYLKYGPYNEVGQEILQAGKLFWNHKDRYEENNYN